MKKVSVNFSNGIWTWLIVGAVIIGIPIVLSFRFANLSNEQKDAFVAVGAFVWVLLITCGSMYKHITFEDTPSDEVSDPLPRLTHEQWKSENDRRSGFVRY